MFSCNSSRADNLDALRELVTRRAVVPVVQRTYGLEETQVALEDSASGKHVTGKLALRGFRRAEG